MIQDPQTMEIEEIIPDVMAEMVRMDKDAMEMARAVREEKAAMARETVRDVMEMARAVREEKAAMVRDVMEIIRAATAREMARDVTETVRAATVREMARDVTEMVRAAMVREMARDVMEMVRAVTVRDVTVQGAREPREKILILWAQE